MRKTNPIPGGLVGRGHRVPPSPLGPLPAERIVQNEANPGGAGRDEATGARDAGQMRKTNPILGGIRWPRAIEPLPHPWDLWPPERIVQNEANSPDGPNSDKGLRERQL